MTQREHAKSEPPTANRRREMREAAFVLAEVTCPSGKQRLGAIKDASAEGVSMLVATHIEIGDHLEIAIELDEGEVLKVAGEVVRVADVPRDGPWLHRVGVQINPPSQELKLNAVRIRERQEKGWRGRGVPDPNAS